VSKIIFSFCTTKFHVAYDCANDISSSLMTCAPLPMISLDSTMRLSTSTFMASSSSADSGNL